MSYYRSRAGEYDEWFLRQGRYDCGPEQNRLWRSEVEEVRGELRRFEPAGDMLELACGTGWWTGELARHADHITAVDASPEVLEINREKLADERANYLQADLFTWRPDALYDVVFFSFWLSQVPPEKFSEFWSVVRDSLRPGGRVFFIDSLRPEKPAVKERPLGDPTTVRQLNDGREFRIFKTFYDPEGPLRPARGSRLGLHDKSHGELPALRVRRAPINPPLSYAPWNSWALKRLPVTPFDSSEAR